MKDRSSNTPGDDEPSAAELTEIEREFGLFSAEMVLLDAEIRIMAAEHLASSVDWRRLRRAIRDLLHESADFYPYDRDGNEYPDTPKEHTT